MPLPIDVARLKRGTQKVMVFARLRDDVSKQQAQAEMDAIAQRLARQYPASNGGWGVNIITLRDDMLKRAGMGITMLFGTVVFVLLIACGNVANMLLARASARQSEIAVRAALGANRRRLLRQLLTESLLLALSAAVLGLLLSWQSIRLMAYMASRSQIHIPGLAIDHWVLLFGLAVALATVLLFGLAPALHATRVDLVSALKERETGTGADRRARRKRDGLIVAEVALAIVFLLATSMMARMMNRVRQGVSDPGFNMKDLIVFNIEAPEGARPAQIAELNNLILESIRSVPGVQSAGGAESFDFTRAGAGSPRSVFVGGGHESGVHLASVSTITPGFLDAIQIPVLRGRTFIPQDSTASSAVAVINQTMARRYWPGSDPLGKTFKFGTAESKEPWLTVVGVVGDTWNFGPAFSSVYLALPENEGRPVAVAVRALVPPSALIPALKDTVRRIDKSQMLEDMQPALKLASSELGDSSFVIGLIGSFAVLALVLAAAGIYGVMSYNVAERRREIGLRMALGGRRRQVLGQLVRRALALMLGGLLLGGFPVVGFALFQMNRYKLGIAGGNVLMAGGVCLLLLACGFLAALVPAYRAIRVDPMVALRCE